MLTWHRFRARARRDAWRRPEGLLILARGRIARALVATAATLLSAVVVAYPTAPTVAAQTPSASQQLPTTQFTAGCSIVSQVPGVRPITTIGCSPGFASGYDQLTIYSRSPGDPGAHDTSSLNMSDAVWLFTTGESGAARLIIDFHPNPDGPGLRATMYDDQDDDRVLAYTVEDGLPRSTETDIPTVTVLAPDGWWARAGTINYNLELLIDGQLQASFGAADFYRRMRTDGAVDFRILVHDDNHDGRPDWQLSRAYSTLSESSAISRSELLVSTRGDRPIDNYIFWPLLGLSGGLQEGYVGGQTQPYVVQIGAAEFIYGIVKDYNQSFAPIQIAWNDAEIRYVGEFVASRGSGSNWFIYSLTPFGVDGGTVADFENPFMFYDLAGANDGYPDLSVRQEYYNPGNQYFRNEVGGPFDQPIQTIRYTWDQDHDQSWDYKLGLFGKHPVEHTVTLGSISVKTIPYEEFPSWVTERAWDIASFVAVDHDMWTTEGIYEQPFSEVVLRNRYFTGGLSEPPEGSYGVSSPGYRGEYSLAFGQQPYLYLSPIDRMLHLQGAEGGVWNRGGREVHYRNLGGPHLNQWVIRQGEEEIESLTLIAGQLILSDEAGVRIKSVDVPPALFTTLPPTNHDEWARLGARLEQHKAPFQGDDLAAMFDQFAGPVQTLPWAHVSEFRQTADGFRAVLALPVPSAIDVPWAAGFGAGRYLLHYRSGRYSVEVLTGSKLELRPTAPAGERTVQRRGLELSVAVRNVGGEDARRVPIGLSATLDGGPPLSLGPVLVDVPSGGSADARFAWTPPAAGEWLIEATAAGMQATGEPIILSVEPAPASGLPKLLAAQDFEPRVATLLGALLAALALLAGGLTFRLWRGQELSPSRATTAAGGERDATTRPSGERG